ncbi:MAG: broad specificity phosphatase PhoE [Colwellia polaris]|jgi:broad specificity phosphatase PhoE
MTVFYLVRHGQASFSADNYDQLSDTGVEQALLVGGYLEKKIPRLTKVITGEMLRHKQTAEHSLLAFTSSQNATFATQEVDLGWNEYDHQNILAAYNSELATPGSARKYLAKQENPTTHFKELFINAINQWIQADEKNPRPINTEYSESFSVFSRRVIAALEQAAEQNPNGHVVIYTSGGPISIIVCYLLGLPLSRFIDINWSLVNAGVTKIVTRTATNKLTLSTLNEHDIFEQQSTNNLITYT